MQLSSRTQSPSTLPLSETRRALYWNLHQNCFSCLDRTKGSPTYGRVVERPAQAVLKDVSFTVRPGGQARVRESGCKNVHAFVEGTRYREKPLPDLGKFRSSFVKYNPYETDTFVDELGNPVHSADFVICGMSNQKPTLLAVNPSIQKRTKQRTLQ